MTPDDAYIFLTNAWRRIHAYVVSSKAASNTMISEEISPAEYAGIVREYYRVLRSSLYSERADDFTGMFPDAPECRPEIEIISSNGSEIVALEKRPGTGISQQVYLLEIKDGIPLIVDRLRLVNGVRKPSTLI